mmetsp:Transcript_27461/g.27686  ORF Transcript_27461/g.27686 Transcript_27461/m.27686 type:complete len:267 (-) Transcript_27461:97-897(-)
MKVRSEIPSGITGTVTHRYFRSIFHVNDGQRGYWMLSPNGFVKRRWHFLGFLLFLCQLALKCSIVFDITLPDNWTTYHLNCYLECLDTILDLYFFIDFIIQFRTGYVDEYNNLVLEPNQVQSRLYNRWLLPGVFLMLPIRTLLIFWRSRPAFRLLYIKNSEKPIKRFVFSREFRKQAIGTLKAFFTEKKWVEATLGIHRPSRSLPHKALRLFTGGYRIVHHLGLLSLWSQVLSSLSKVTATLRGIHCMSILSHHGYLLAVTPRYYT